jgi:hypothetical protein
MRLALLCGLVIFGVSGTAVAHDGSGAPSDANAPVRQSGRDIEVDPTLTPEVDGCVRSKTVIQVAAPPQAVRDAILDLDARVQESWIVDSVEVYRDEVTAEHIHRRARWILSVLGVEVVYHTYYDWDAKTSEIEWGLDDSRSNDLRRAVGTYKLDASNDGTTKLTYVFEIGTRHLITEGLKRRLTVRSVRELLDSIRTRSEDV